MKSLALVFIATQITCYNEVNTAKWNNCAIFNKGWQITDLPATTFEDEHMAIMQLQLWLV